MEPEGGVMRPFEVSADLAHETSALRPVDFEGFYRRTWIDVYKPLVATIRDPDLAAEAVDEAMVRAYSRWPRVSRASNPEGWVYRVAYHWAIDRLRRRSTERRMQRHAVPEMSVGDAPVVEPRLGDALSTLPLEQRAVVVLSCVFDWSEKEIAAALGIRNGTVKSRLHRGLKTLREELGA